MRQPVTLFSNQIRNPVWAETLVNGCLELARHDYTGIINIAGAQALSRADFALKMLDYWDVQERATLSVAPYTGSEWPLNCEMDVRLATAVLKTPLTTVAELLNLYKAITV
jgi:dTDP-4-dehydrorhamnose reductase